MTVLLNRVAEQLAKPGPASRAWRAGVFALLLSPILLIVVFSYRQMHGQLTELTLAQREAAAGLGAVVVQERLDRLVDLAKSLAARPMLRQGAGEGAWDLAVGVLEDIPGEFSYVDRIFLTDPEGTETADTPVLAGAVGKNFAHRDWYQGVSRSWQPYVSEVYRRAAEPRINVIAVAVPVHAPGGAVAGILVIQVKVERIFDWIQSIRVGQSGFVYVTDHRGRLIAHPRVDPQADVTDFSSVPAVRQALRGERGVLVGANPIDRERRISAYAPVPGYGWTVVVAQTSDAAFALRDAALRGAALLYGLFLLGGALFAAALLRFVAERKRDEWCVRELNEDITRVARDTLREKVVELGKTNEAFKQEIAERRQLEAQVRQLSQAIEQSPNSVMVTDVEGRIEYVNLGFSRLTGYTPGEVRGKNPRFLKSGRQSPEMYQRLWRTIAGGGEWHGELCNRRKNGEEFWVSSTISCIRDARGAVTNFLAIQEDISRQKAIQRELEESEERFRQLTETIREVFWMTDPKTTRMLYVSPAYEEVWGRSRQLLYQDPQEFLRGVHPEDQGVLVEALKRQSEEGTFTAEYRVVRPDGSIRWIQDRGFPIRDAQGTIYRIAGIAEDITDRKRAEEELRTAQAQLVQAAKMESIGQLASGIAHDFNNYLSVIHGFAELIQMRSKGDEKLVSQLGEILHASESGTALVQQLMAFSRQRPVQPSVFSMTDSVSRIGGLLQRLVGAGVQIVFEPSPTSLMVKMDPTVLEQILMNLASNARDAMQKQGTITIRAARAVVDEAFRSTRPGMKAGDYVRLSVQDTGPGMEPAVAARVFEPFFTTKKMGQGTGLGLAVVYGLVKQYDGYIDLETAPGRGTTFHVYFPHQVVITDGSTAPAEHPGAGAAPAASRGAKRARVLVVDDEPGSRQLCEQILQDAYEVVTAPSGAEALAVLGRNGVDVLLTDIQMPEMDGVTLLEKALERHPGLKVAVMSAFMTKEREQQLRALSSACEIIRKPLTVSGVRDSISRCLAA